MGNHKREAISAITGYLYQFLVTIKTILSLGNNSEYTIEGIEDIDISSNDETQLVQIKYHEAKDFCPSAIYKPIGYMFAHFLENQNSTINYKLYAYFADKTENMTDTIFTEDYLKRCLSNISKNILFTHANIDDFKHKFKFEPAEKYDEIEIAIMALLKDNLNCDDEDVERYYYNNAFVLIAEMAKEKDEANRKITKQEFLSQINHKKYLFRKWLLEEKGEKDYIKHIKENIKELRLTQDVKNKYLIIGKHLLDNTQKDYSIINLIADLKLQPGKHTYENKLWTVILDLTIEEIKKIKCNLIDKEIFFNDGYENIKFSSTYFSRPHHFSRSTYTINDASFFIKIISLETYKNNFYTENIDVFINLSNSLNQAHKEQLISSNQSQYIEISNIRNIISIKKILNIT